MLGTMMDVPMLVSRMLDHAADSHPEIEVVARDVRGKVERETWAGMRHRAKCLAQALSALGIGVDDCVGSLAWNTLDHLDVFYASLGIGAGLHTLNPRLSADDLQYMVDSVGETIVFIDAATLELAERLAPLVPAVTRWIFMGAGAPEATTLPGLVCKDDLVAGYDGALEWPLFDERQAATICFTSGTTGRPKGVVYSHRSITLSSMNMSMADMYATAQPGVRECVMPIAAIFHANAWMMPLTAPMNGHKLVLPGRAFDPASLVELIRDERVTLAAAVPTIWQDVLDHVTALDVKLPWLRTALLSGTRPAAALTEALATYGISLCQSWGMTEVPGATRGSPPLGTSDLPGEERHRIQTQYQGRTGFQIEMKIVGDGGIDLTGTGLPGQLFVRGPSVAGCYLGDPSEAQVHWLDTGDIALIGEGGRVQIVDRSKDVIKSGGEWISTLALESAAASHPHIHQAAAIGVPHPRWQERPLLLCTVIAGKALDTQQVLAHMAQHVAKWCLPDEVRVIASMPLTTTGKIDKVALRRAHAPEANA